MSPHSLLRPLVILLSLPLFTTAVDAVSQNQQARTAPALVSGAALQTMLPSPAGWTRKSDKTNQIALSPTCDYTFAAAVFEKDQMRIRVTVADTGRTPESLMALALMVLTLPDDYKESVPPASTIKRLNVSGSPAAELWDGAKNEGEITVVVDGRFVVTLEGFQLDKLETLRAMLQQIDLNKVAALK